MGVEGEGRGEPSYICWRGTCEVNELGNKLIVIVCHDCGGVFFFGRSRSGEVLKDCLEREDI